MWFRIVNENSSKHWAYIVTKNGIFIAMLEESNIINVSKVRL